MYNTCDENPTVFCSGWAKFTDMETDYPKFTLSKTFIFKNKRDLRKFLNKLLDLADELQHDPIITIEYNVLRILLSTTDIGYHVSDLDYSMALKINELYVN